MRVMVTGSRDWEDHSTIYTVLGQFQETHKFEPVTIIHGGARGADEIAQNAALSYGYHVEVHPADWRKYGNYAGIKRNAEMIDSGVDLVLSFWDRKSRGTKHAFTLARNLGLSVELYESAII